MPLEKPTSHGLNAVRREYAKLASDYDARWSFYVRATTEETLKRIALPAGYRVLDVGCGTGAMLARLAASADAVLFGIDPVPEMLDQARSKVAEKVDLRVGKAEQIPFGPEEFDVVISCNMLHYVRQPELAVREMHRVLRPGGKVVVTDWCHDFLTCRACDLYLRAFDKAHCKTYKEGECAALIRSVGFTDVNSERYKINWLWGLMTVQGRKAATAPC